jgi:hypothetical protein
MESTNLDSYCGIYCGACDIILTHKTGTKSKLASFWNESTVKAFHQRIGLHNDKNRTFSYQCDGCKGETQFVNCAVCQIRGCAINYNVEHCIDCTKYPCSIIVESRKVETLLPHLKCNHENMEEISKVGIAQWLSIQQEKWKCPKCKAPFSWYTRKCTNCGEDLKKYTFNFSLLNATLLKLGLYLLPWKKK